MIVLGGLAACETAQCTLVGAVGSFAQWASGWFKVQTTQPMQQALHCNIICPQTRRLIPALDHAEDLCIGRGIGRGILVVQ